MSGALALVAGHAHAEGVCIPPQVQQAVTKCADTSDAPRMMRADLLTAAEALRLRTGGTGNLPSGKARKGGAVTNKFAPQPFHTVAVALEAALHRDTCEHAAKVGDAKAEAEQADVEYARARMHFEAQHWEEAAVLFRDVALRRSRTEVGIYAQQLYLESINILGSSLETPRPACYEDMARDVPTFIELYCKSGKETANQESCGVLLGIQRDIERLRAEDLVKAADKGGRDAQALYEKAGSSYLELWKKYGEAACAAKQPACYRSEEVLYNAARAFQAAHLVPRAIAALQVLVDPRYNLERTALANRARHTIGTLYLAMGSYEEAASWLEAFAEADPRAELARDTLSDAVALRLALGQRDKAITDANHFNKQYGSSSPARTAAIVFAVGADALTHGDAEGARKHLVAAMSSIDKNATIDVRIRAHAALGAALVARGKRPAAAVEYGTVREIQRAVSSGALTLSSIDEDKRPRALADLLSAGGEAAVFFADEQRLALEGLRRPVVGAVKPEDAGAAPAAALGAWIARKQAAIDEVERAYAEVAAMPPTPPRRWVVVAAARIARLRGRFAAEIRSLRAPADWKATGATPQGQPWVEVQAAWADALDRLALPAFHRAEAAQVQCVTLGARLQTGADEVRRCAAWLSRHAPAAYPKIDELTPALSLPAAWVEAPLAEDPSSPPRPRDATPPPEE